VNDEQKLELFQTAHQQLFSWCSEHDFAGHDPFDGLNSSSFQATPLAKSRNARLLWTQLLKRSPLDLRSAASVPLQRNAKGIALFALALLADHRRLRTRESEKEARTMLDTLLSMSNDDFSGTAWGYNFDWQSRNFFAPRGSPTIVPTAFAARALMEAAEEFDDNRYFATARSVCNFILMDLRRTAETDTEICFSYSPTGHTQIFNASLLAAEVLAGVFAKTREAELCDTAIRAARYVVNRQLPDGSWTYGTKPAQAWVDNFHTAFILFSLSRIIEVLPSGMEFQASLERGYRYWSTHFFLAEGWPKYYHDDPYPADAHAAASAIVTFLELGDLDSNSSGLADDVALWTLINLRDKDGYFYYQRRRFYTVRKPYMRWSQAWMTYALSRLLEEKARVD
jgi:hypothetical protein